MVRDPPRPRRSSPYNCIWEFGYTIGTQQCDMLFTSVAGHLMELEFEGNYKRWRGCSPLELYTAPVAKSVPQVSAGWRAPRDVAQVAIAAAGWVQEQRLQPSSETTGHRSSALVGWGGWWVVPRKHTAEQGAPALPAACAGQGAAEAQSGGELARRAVAGPVAGLRSRGREYCVRGGVLGPRPRL